MMDQRTLLGSTERIKALAALLAQCESVKRLGADAKGEPESWALAYALSELEGSFRQFLDPQLTALLAARGDEQIFDCLHDIGEELRHMLYHIRASRFFGYLEPAVSDHESE